MRQFKYYSAVLTILLFMGFVSCSADKRGKEKNASSVRQQNKSVGGKRQGPKFEFTKEIHKFGAITQGEIVVCNFYYKNSGDSDLIITNVEVGCGCTAVKWDKKPLSPGKEARITVEFNSQGRYGKQYKTVTVFANVPGKVKELVITAEVK